MTKTLSPAAQAVLAACDQAFDKCGTTAQGLAAALETAANQVVPPEQETPWGSIVQPHAAELRIRNQLLAIAAELKKTDD